MDEEVEGIVETMGTAVVGDWLAGFGLGAYGARRRFLTASSIPLNASKGPERISGLCCRTRGRFSSRASPTTGCAGVSSVEAEGDWSVGNDGARARDKLGQSLSDRASVEQGAR